MQESFRKKIKQLIPKKFLIQKLDSRASNCILFTFDDSPHPEITPVILKKLEVYEARAIFFIPGRCVEKAPHVLTLIQDQGHIIGNHTYIHSRGRQPWFGAYWRDLIRCQAIIKRYTGKKPELFRPAGGQISPTSLLVPWLMGLKTVTWSLEVNDWRFKTASEAEYGAKDLANKIASRDIVLLHDDNPFIIQILDMILPMIRERKFDLYSGIDFI